jgi:glycosyltransferase involved in cell wall biosynthesis
MLVALDATPLIGHQTGVGRYVANLVPHLAARDDMRVVLVPFTLRGRRQMPRMSDVTIRQRPAPARLLRAAWLRSELPPVELFAGRCDVFHGTNFVLPPRRRAAGVVTIHDLSYLQFPGTVTADVLQYRKLVPRAVRAGAVVATPSHAVADEVRDTYGLPEERVHVTPLGVGPEWFGPQPAPRLSQVPGQYLLFVGTRAPRKNLATLLAAYRAGRKDFDLPPLVLVGPGGWGPHTTKQPGLITLDHVPDPALLGLVANASAVVMPSLYEGFGLPVLEALACGRPVVASDIPAHRELAADQALYADPRDVEDWTKKILAVLSEPAGTPASRSQRARLYDWDRCAYATLEAYRGAVSLSAEGGSDR